jgi:hypothetical protein
MAKKFHEYNLVDNLGPSANRGVKGLKLTGPSGSLFLAQIPLLQKLPVPTNAFPLLPLGVCIIRQKKIFCIN